VEDDAASATTSETDNTSQEAHTTRTARHHRTTNTATCQEAVGVLQLPLPLPTIHPWLHHCLLCPILAIESLDINCTVPYACRKPHTSKGSKR
jgi:hypothetical protein